MKIAPAIFEAYLKCPTKCWLRATGEAASGNTYAEWVQAQNVAYRETGTARLLAASPQDEVALSPDMENVKASTWRLASSLAVQAEMDSCALESELHAVERVPAGGRGKAAQFIPIRFVFTNKLGKDDKLLLAFDAVALSKVLKREVSLGKIIHGDNHSTLKVKTSALASEVRKHREKITALLASPTPPDLVLNRHCGECEFQARCRKIAVEKDDLSLLANMSAKERQKLRNKGIFTVTQLSYTFRPRRRPKKLRDKREKYHHSLKALAIREKKIHIVGSPELKIEGTPVYLDVEGLPDRDFYYLIGLRIGDGDTAVQHSLWADTVADEAKIWRKFLAILETVAKPVLVHYGSYEMTYIQRMRERYGYGKVGSSTAIAVRTTLNLLSFIFSRIYLPTYSNGLKEVARWFGYKWTEQNPSGTTAIYLRQDWEQCRTESSKRRLLSYNREDCTALGALARQLALVVRQPSTFSGADFVDTPRAAATERSKEIHETLSSVLRSAHWIYREKKISLRPTDKGVTGEVDARRRKPAQRRKLPACGGQTIRVPRKRKCPYHQKSPTFLKASKREVEHALADISFTKKGCKKVLVRYVGRGGFCSNCCTIHSPPAIQKLRGQTFGSGFHIWAIYLRVALRLPVRMVAKATRDLLNEDISHNSISEFVAKFSKAHRQTEDALLSAILKRDAIHVDETKMSILGVQQFVWVLTDGIRVIFRLTPTRETEFLQKILTQFKGTVVSDFYSGYDALPCRQQKCLVHLIRDLNDDLWKFPFDEEYERFVSAVRDLIVPIIEDIGRYGLKSFHLRKHIRRVSRFYDREIAGGVSSGELILKYRKRFERYKDSLFTFLEHDGVAWNNNAAERAIRHLAVQRKISGAFSENGATHYLRLLAIAQTCRFQEKSFLGFLLSGLKNVDAYKETHRQRGMHRDG